MNLLSTAYTIKLLSDELHIELHTGCQMSNHLHPILLYEELRDVVNTLIETLAPFSELPNVAGAKHNF